MKCLTKKNELAMFLHLSKKLTVYPAAMESTC